MKTLILTLMFFLPIFLLAQDYSGSFEFEGKLRNYEVYLPQDYQPNMPVVLGLHGYTESIQFIKNYTLLHEYADTAGFIVVYPEGSYTSTGKSGWNTGLRNHPFGQQDTTSNDVGFLSTLIDTLDAHYDIDSNRVYCCGFSMGGEMTYRMAIEKGQLFAAYASVSGKLNDISANSGIPYRPSPILHFHGTADNVETYDGENDGNLWPVEETINYWLDNNNCVYQADTISLPDLNPNDGSTVQKISYRDCSEENHVLFFKIHNGGHGWPGSTEGMYPGGKPNRDINASDIILNFFNGYDSPPADIAYGKSLESFCKYIPPEGDTLKIKAGIVNSENHSVTVYAIIDGDETDFQDSIQLFDDGMHGDSLASDNIFEGEKIFTGLDEDFYEVKLRTTDVDKSHTTYFPNHTYFTTAGPVVIDSCVIADILGNTKKLTLFLKNEGKTNTATKILVELTTTDTSSVSEIRFGTTGAVDIQPGETVELGQNIFIKTKDSAATVLFKLNISSNGHTFWQESIYIDLTPTDIGEDGIKFPKEFTLGQNYPNPFNPSTTIKYQIPSNVKGEMANVKLIVYDVLGREVATLVSEQQKAGYYEVDWNAANNSSGVYFYKIQAGDFVDTKKMVLLR